MKWLVLSVLLTSPIASISAERTDNAYPTAQDMSGWCNAYRTATSDGGVITVNPTMQSQACYGAFMTVQQLAATTFDRRSNASVIKVCAPERSTSLEWIKVFLHYADDHPERGHEKFTDVLLSAAWKAWPCASRK